MGGGGGWGKGGSGKEKKNGEQSELSGSLGRCPFPLSPVHHQIALLPIFFFFFTVSSVFLPFYPISVTEPDSRLIKRCFVSGATGESTSSIRGGGGGEGGAVRDIKDYERRIYLIISETEG